MTSSIRVSFLVCFTLFAGCSDIGSEAHVQRFAVESDAPVVTVASTTQIEKLNAVLPGHRAITRAYAVRSEDHAWAHYIAAKLRSSDGSDLPNVEIGVWFMQDGMDIPGVPMAVDSDSTILPRRLKAVEFHGSRRIVFDKRELRASAEADRRAAVIVYPDPTCT